jgi:hypothetical protein
MNRILFVMLLISASPIAAATSSADLESIAKVLEQNTMQNSTLDKNLLSLLREPAKTLENRTLPSTAAQYTGTIDTALKLQPDPTHWFATGGALPGWLKPNVTCGVTLAFWKTELRPVTLDSFVLASGAGNCPSVFSAAIARAWAWKLRQVGR